jgi:hypothetical protein
LMRGTIPYNLTVINPLLSVHISTRLPRCSILSLHILSSVKIWFWGKQIYSQNLRVPRKNVSEQLSCSFINTSYYLNLLISVYLIKIKMPMKTLKIIPIFLEFHIQSL